MADIAEATRMIIAQTIGRPPQDLAPDARLDDLGVNSLQLTEIIMDLEDKFEIEIDENAAEAWAKLKTVGDVIDAVAAMAARKT